MTDLDPIDALKKAIEDAGSQNALARRIGLPQAYLSQVLSGSRPPSENLLAGLGLKRVVVRASEVKPPLTVAEAELSVRTGNAAKRIWGDDMLLSDLCAKTDDDLLAAGFMRKSIKEIREIGEWL